MAIEDVWELWYRRGYYDALHRLVTLWDEPTMAAELLEQYGHVITDDIDEKVAKTIAWLAETEGVCGKPNE